VDAAVIRPPACPVCGGPTERRRARQGPRAGLEFWGCRRFPACDGLINIDPPATPSKGDPAGAERRQRSYAHLKFEQARARDRLKRRALLPLAIGLGVLLIALAYVVALPLGRPWVWVAPTLVLAVWMFGLLRLPFEAFVWAKGLEGERKVAEALEPLKQEGFILLANRPVPLARGDIDCIAIGPPGVFTIEIKNWGGRAYVRNEALWVGTADRSWVVDQIYRESVSVQLALASELNALHVVVVPIICAVGGLRGTDRRIRGVQLLDVKNILPWLRAQPVLLDEATLDRIAGLAERAFPEPLPWDEVWLN
jgi:ssDNA-binding Zn-finger/Zn-ribbon topoisomerase 1